MKSLFFLVFAFSFSACFAQPFTHQDSLRGSITPERAWWNLTYYNLAVNANPADSSLKGTNDIYFTALSDGKILQIDLQDPMKIESILHDGKKLSYKKDGNAYFVEFKKPIKKNTSSFIQINYSGKPTISTNPPWNGGITWKYDANNKPFVATSVQGEGASMWWPCKDHMYDEPDSMSISITAPKGLIAVSNGRLRATKLNKDSTKTFFWHVSNPINNYGVNLNIGDYVHFSVPYQGEKGQLDCDYWVLSYNLEKAKIQFNDGKRTLEALEYWFGPYPFYEDSYKLVEVPYLGMEHQSSVTYGNGYKNGYRGRDLSATGWGMTFDFIIVHESGHEWFANNITYKDMADMWIHESFTNYSESLFLEYFEGKQAGSEYLRGLRSSINNDKPIIAPYNVNASGSSDMYYKGSNMLNTIRQLAPSDSSWRMLLRGLNKDFYHQTVTTAQIENYMSAKIGINLEPIFNQYLRDTRIPVLQYRFNNGRLMYRWNQTVAGFEMPVRVQLNDSVRTIQPKEQWQQFSGTFQEEPRFQIDPNFYIIGQNLTVKSSYKKE